MSVLHAIKQIGRGCGEMPHVGEHPGTFYAWAMVIAGGVAGLRGDLLGFIGGAAVMSAFILPIYFVGAYERAELSDRLVARNLGKSQDVSQGE